MSMQREKAAALSPEDAVRALAGLERYEETLTAKAFGITMMAFGIAGAATSLSYAYAADWIAARGYAWALSFLWIPWIFAASLVAATVWKAHAVSLPQHDKPRGSWWWSVLFSFAYIALLAGVWALDEATPIDLGQENHNLLTLGLFTVLLALFLQRRYGASWMLRVLYGVAVVLAALAFAYAALDLPSVAANLLAVLTSLALWVGSGAYIAARG